MPDAELGYKAGAAKTETRTLNRGSGAASAQTEEGTEASHEAEQDRATKVMNRAQQIVKDTPTISKRSHWQTHMQLQGNQVNNASFWKARNAKQKIETK